MRPAAALAAFLLASLHAWAQGVTPAAPPGGLPEPAAVGEFPGWDAPASVQRLARKPQKLSISWEDDWRGIRGAAGSTADYHFLVPVPAEYLFAALTDFASAPKVNPMILDLELDMSAYPPLLRQRERFGFSLLGLTIAPTFDMEGIYEPLGPGEYRGRWAMVDNPDSDYLDVSGWFYVRQVVLSGKVYSYFRWVQTVAKAKPYPAMRQIMAIFTPSQMEGLLQRYAKAAVKRFRSP